MKILVISDIHSNPWAVKAILEKESQYDRLFCAGDLVDYGTAPREVVTWLQKCPDKLLVQGNHDEHTVRIWREGNFDRMAPGEFKWVHHNCQRLDGDLIKYLDDLPLHLTFEADGQAYLIQHQYDEGYGTVESRAQFEAYWRAHTPTKLWNKPRRCLIFGHSHRQCIHELGDGMRWLNPGSVSYRRPDDPDKTAHYAIIENGEIRLRHVPYDHSPLLREARRYAAGSAMMTTELQDFFFFFGDAKTSRDPLPEEGGPI